MENALYGFPEIAVFVSKISLFRYLTSTTRTKIPYACTFHEVFYTYSLWSRRMEVVLGARGGNRRGERELTSHSDGSVLCHNFCCYSTSGLTSESHTVIFWLFQRILYLGPIGSQSRGTQPLFSVKYSFPRSKYWLLEFYYLRTAKQFKMTVTFI